MYFDRGWLDGCNEDRRETACGCGSGGVLRHDIQILQISSSPRGAFSRSEFLNFIGHCREIAADARKSLILANPGAVWTKKKRPALRENRDRKSTRLNYSH